MTGHSYYVNYILSKFYPGLISSTAEPNAKLSEFIIKHGSDFHCCPYNFSKLTHICIASFYGTQANRIAPDVTHFDFHEKMK